MKLIFYFIFLFFITSSTLFARLPYYPYGEYPSDYYQFWFLYESEKRQGQSQVIFRPFYSHYHEKKTDFHYKTILFPFYYEQNTNHWGKWSFLFLFNGDYSKHDDTGQDHDYIITPFVAWGTGSNEKDNYKSFFPFYGTIKSKIAWSEINFVMFPFYSNWSHKNFKAHSILWPLTVYGDNGIRSEYRILPFFSHKSHVGKYNHNSILWPFIQWGENLLDKKEPTNYFVFIPFFTYKSSNYDNMKSYGIFPIPIPLFQYGYDKRRNELDIVLFMYLFQYGYSDDKDYRKLIVFPLFGYSRYASKEFSFITPFYIHSRSDTYLLKSDEYFLFPFVINADRTYIKEDRSDKYFKLWPLFKYHKDQEDNITWNTFSLFPIRSNTYERIWDPFWSILEYKSMINGEKRMSVLMRLYSQRWSENFFEMEIPLLFNYTTSLEKSKVSLFYGLFGIEREEEKRFVRLFWFIKI